MTEPPKAPPGPTSGPDDRQRRLAEALRANLKRRKIQSRGREGEPAAADPKTTDPE